VAAKETWHTPLTYFCLTRAASFRSQPSNGYVVVATAGNEELGGLKYAVFIV